MIEYAREHQEFFVRAQSPDNSKLLQRHQRIIESPYATQTTLPWFELDQALDSIDSDRTVARANIETEKHSIDKDKLQLLNEGIKRSGQFVNLVRKTYLGEKTRLNQSALSDMGNHIFTIKAELEKRLGHEVSSQSLMTAIDILKKQANLRANYRIVTNLNRSEDYIYHQPERDREYKDLEKSWILTSTYKERAVIRARMNKILPQELFSAIPDESKIYINFALKQRESNYRVNFNSFRETNRPARIADGLSTLELLKTLEKGKILRFPKPASDPVVKPIPLLQPVELVPIPAEQIPADLQIEEVYEVEEAIEETQQLKVNIPIKAYTERRPTRPFLPLTLSEDELGNELTKLNIIQKWFIPVKFNNPLFKSELNLGVNFVGERVGVTINQEIAPDDFMTRPLPSFEELFGPFGLKLSGWFKKRLEQITPIATKIAKIEEFGPLVRISRTIESLLIKLEI